MQQIRTPKQEPPQVQATLRKVSESKPDAKEVAKKLLKSGAISAIKVETKERHSFKRSKASERKRSLNDRPGGIGYQPYAANHPTEEESEAAPSSTRPAVKSLYDSFVSGGNLDEDDPKHFDRDPEKEGPPPERPRQGNTLYVHGVGLAGGPAALGLLPLRAHPLHLHGGGQELCHPNLRKMLPNSNKCRGPTLLFHHYHNKTLLKSKKHRCPTLLPRTLLKMKRLRGLTLGTSAASGFDGNADVFGRPASPITVPLQTPWSGASGTASEPQGECCFASIHPRTGDDVSCSTSCFDLSGPGRASPHLCSPEEAWGSAKAVDLQGSTARGSRRAHGRGWAEI
ncbi:hypothetical protein HPB47_002770 [Ixodes persulcatus]|uniref:Uncharacterized protein n=1 Tax=Ixodes persulcatus TaxID=34615 RepID=A0AC60PKN5_IXOPE|nr:hypothetical protein HPB47_002770 [Ixodes persulcatus]